MNNQILAAISAEISALRQLYDVVFELKKIRAKLELLGVSTLPEEEFPLPNELRHIDRTKLTNIFVAMDDLDAAFINPSQVTGMPPIKVIVDVIP